MFEEFEDENAYMLIPILRIYAKRLSLPIWGPDRLNIRR